MPKKYWIFPQVSGVVIWKLNKANTAFLDKEYLSDWEVLSILANLVKHLKTSHDGDIKISSWGVEEFSIVFPKKD
jgi:hypothetical protein